VIFNNAEHAMSTPPLQRFYKRCFPGNGGTATTAAVQSDGTLEDTRSLPSVSNTIILVNILLYLRVKQVDMSILFSPTAGFQNCC